MGTRKRYRPDWCTVHETPPDIAPDAAGTIDDALDVARPLARLGLGLQRRRRQAQGDDIDIDAAVEALARATEAFAAARMNRGIRQALAGKRVEDV